MPRVPPGIFLSFFFVGVDLADPRSPTSLSRSRPGARLGEPGESFRVSSITFLASQSARTCNT